MSNIIARLDLFPSPIRGKIDEHNEHLSISLRPQSAEGPIFCEGPFHQRLVQVHAKKRAFLAATPLVALAEGLLNKKTARESAAVFLRAVLKRG